MRSAPSPALRRACPGASVVPADLGSGFISRSSSIALAEKYRSLGFAGAAEVSDLDGPPRREEDIGRLDVPVYEPPPMSIGERVQKLYRHPPYELLIEAPAAAATATTEEIPEIPARDTFDNDEGQLAILGDVVDLNYVLVVQGGHRTGLLPEAPPERGHLGVAMM